MPSLDWAVTRLVTPTECPGAALANFNGRQELHSWSYLTAMAGPAEPLALLSDDYWRAGVSAVRMNAAMTPST